LAPGLIGVQKELMELAAVPNALIKRKPQYDFFPDDSDLDSSSDESDTAVLDSYDAPMSGTSSLLYTSIFDIGIDNPPDLP